MPVTVHHSRARPLWVALFATLACLFALAGPAHAELAVHVHGNQLVDGEGHSIRLLGVNFAGAEYSCIQDRGIWSAPTDEAAIAAMVAWHIDVVRIPLNEDCWLGVNGAPAEYSGGVYQRAIHEYVQALHDAGLYVILDLQWSAPGANQATGLQQMADANHSLDFWRSVAASFRGDPAVLFDLYSEPHEIDWECWLEGCTLPWSDGGTWQAAGMQALVDAVRSQGATQPLLLGGIDWANDLSGWLAHLPEDPQHQLVASAHLYSTKACNSTECWSEALAPIAERYPVVAGEIGEFDCEDHFIDQFMNWADANDVSYLGWTWNTFDCESGPALIADTEGTPTAFGEGLRDRLRTPRTTLEVTPSPAAAGETVTLTAEVGSPTSTEAPAGSVTFQIDGESLAPKPLDADGQATLSLPRLSAGTHKVHVLYSGDEALAAGSSEAQTVNVLVPGPLPVPLSPPPVVPPSSSSPPPATTPLVASPPAGQDTRAAVEQSVHRATTPPRRAQPVRPPARGKCLRTSQRATGTGSQRAIRTSSQRARAPRGAHRERTVARPRRSGPPGRIRARRDRLHRPVTRPPLERR